MRFLLPVLAVYSAFLALGAGPATAKESASRAPDRAASPRPEFWDRIDQQSCFGLARSWYAFYFRSIGSNMRDGWGVGTPDAHEINEQWTDMWCRGDPTFGE